MASGKPLKKMFNTSGMLYKEMKLKDRLPEMTDAEQLEFLSTDGLLVKHLVDTGIRGYLTINLPRFERYLDLWQSE